MANWPVIATGCIAWQNLKMEMKTNQKAALQMFNLQKKKEDAQINIPVVIEMLEDLAALQQAFIHRGRFIPGLEHRCPTIQFKDGENEDEISVAERTHQLYTIALRVIRNSRRIIFLTPRGLMPKTIKACELIKDSFLFNNPGEKRSFDIKIGSIGTILQHSGNLPHAEKSCDEFVIELEQYQSALECCVQEEFPTCAEMELPSDKIRKERPFFRKFFAIELNLKERFRACMNRGLIFLRGK